MPTTPTDTDTDTDIDCDEHSYEVLRARTYQEPDGDWSVDDYDWADRRIVVRPGATEAEVMLALRACGSLDDHADDDLEIDRVVRDDGRVDWFVAVADGPTLVAVWGTEQGGAP